MLNRWEAATLASPLSFPHHRGLHGEQVNAVSCQACCDCDRRERCHRSGGVEQFAKWGGLALSFTGSLLLATSKAAGASPLVFMVLLASNSAWTVAGISTRDRALTISSLIGMGFNLSATLIRL